MVSVHGSLSACVNMAYEVPDNVAEASRLMAKAVMVMCGGAASIGNSIEQSRQTVHIWLKTGDVSYPFIYDVAKVLGVSPWSLSYHRLCALLGEDSPDFLSVVETTPLHEADRIKILEVYND